MRKTTSTLDSDLDRELFETFQRISDNFAESETPLNRSTQLSDYLVLTYARHARRRRWSWKLIGEALKVSPSRASRLYREWQEWVDEKASAQTV